MTSFSQTARSAFSVIGVSAVICGIGARGTVQPASSAELPDIVQAASPSVATMLVYGPTGKPRAQGTAFAIGAGHFVTNQHVIEKAAAADLVFRTGVRVPVQGILAEDTVHDLALVSCPEAAGTVRPLPLRTQLPREGERIVVIGSPLGLQSTVSEGIVSAVRNAADFGSLIQISAAISHGSSGSPVIDGQGRVIAVVRAFLVEGQLMNFSIPAAYVAALEPGTLRSFPSLSAREPSRLRSPAEGIGQQRKAAKPTPSVPAWYGDAAAVLRHANLAWEKEDWDLAARLYERLLELFPEHPIAQQRAAEARSIAAEARRVAEEARQKAAEEERARRERAEKLAHEKANIPLYRETADTYLRMGQWPQAVQWVERVRAVEPDDSWSQQTLENLAKEIAAKYTTAIGGLQRIRNVQAARLTGTATVGDVKLGMLWLWKRPNLFRLELVIDDRKVIQAYDGSVAWTSSGLQADSRPRLMSTEELAGLHGMGDFEGPLVDFESKGSTVTLVGLRTVGDTEAFCIRVTTKNGDTSMWFLDTARCLVVKEEEKRLVAGSQTTVEALLDNYRDVGGILAPHRVRSVGAGTAAGMTFVLEHVELDSALDPSLFSMPATPLVAPDSVPTPTSLGTQSP